MNTIFKCLIFTFFLLSLNACNRNLNLQEGIESFKIQDYRQAFIRLKPEARKGNLNAAYAVGYMYYYGDGVVEDREQALYWIHYAAKGGQKDAIEALRAIEECN